MFIRKLTVSGFKSHRYENTFEFGPGLNVIIGKNGSGKSNTLEAIDVALSDTYAKLNEKGRRDLLSSQLPKYEKAALEVWVDNSEQLIPFNHPTVFRRNFGASVTTHKASVDNCALALSDHPLKYYRAINPLYRIKQGDIGRVLYENDQFRWTLLRNLIGFKTAEEWREAHRVSVDYFKELIAAVELEISQAEEERLDYEQDVSSYENVRELLRRIDTLKFHIVKREYLKHKAKVEEALPLCSHIGKSISQLQTRWQTVCEQLEVAKAEMVDVTRGKVECEVAKGLLLTDIETNLHRLEVLTNEIKSREASQFHDDYGPIVATTEAVKRLDFDIHTKAAALKDMEIEQQSSYASLAKSLSNIDFLTEVIGRQSVKDRKKFRELKEAELVDNRQELARVIKQQKKSHADREKLDEDLRKYQQNLESNLESLKQTKEHEQQLNAQLQKHQANVSRHRVDGDQIWRKKSKLQRELNNVKESLAEIEASIKVHAGKHFNACKFVLEIVAGLKASSDPVDVTAADCYLGTVIENIIFVPNEIRTAVEVSAGLRLFFHVVKNVRTAIRILTEYNRRKYPGEVYFFVEDTVKVSRPVNLVELGIRDVEEILPRIQYSETVVNSMKSIFNGYWLCKDVKGIRVDARIKATFVSVGGDMLKSSGPITGGYRDPSKSVLTDQETKVKLSEKKSQILMDLKAVDDDEQFWVKRNNAMEEIVKVKQEELVQMREEIKNWAVARRNILHGIQSIESSLPEASEHLMKLAQKEEDLNCRISQILADIDNKFSAPSSNPYQARSVEMKTCTKKKHRYVRQRSRRTLLEKELLELRLKKRQSISALDGHSSPGPSSESAIPQGSLASLRATLKSEQKVKQNLHERMKEVLQMEAKMSQSYTEIHHKIDKTQNVLGDIIQELEIRQKALNEASYDRFGKIETELAEKVKALEHLEFTESSAAPKYAEYKKMSSAELCAELAKVTKEQSKQRPIRLHRENEKIKILEEKEILQKYLARAQRGLSFLEKLYDDIAKFAPTASVWILQKIQRLVPQVYAQILLGSGDMNDKRVAELTLYTDSQEFNISSLLDGPNGGNWETINFTGARLGLVSNDGKRYDISTLSGGQRALLALTFILAVQRYCPSSFFLFDEVDQALDERYRAGVVQVIKRFCQESRQQFLCTTFNRDFIRAADSIHLVCNAADGGTSRARRIGLTEALELPFLNSQVNKRIPFLERDDSGSMETDNELSLSLNI